MVGPGKCPWIHGLLSSNVASMISVSRCEPATLSSLTTKKSTSVQWHTIQESLWLFVTASFKFFWPSGKYWEPHSMKEKPLVLANLFKDNMKGVNEWPRFDVTEPVNVMRRLYIRPQKSTNWYRSKQRCTVSLVFQNKQQTLCCRRKFFHPQSMTV